MIRKGFYDLLCRARLSIKIRHIEERGFSRHSDRLTAIFRFFYLYIIFSHLVILLLLYCRFSRSTFCILRPDRCNQSTRHIPTDSNGGTD